LLRQGPPSKELAENHHPWLRVANLSGFSLRPAEIAIFSVENKGVTMLLLPAFGTAVAFL